MTSDPQPARTINWRRLCVAVVGILIVTAAIRLAGVAAGIVRDTTASHVLSAVSWFVLMIGVQAVMPWVMPGVLPPERRRERLYRVAQIAAVTGVIYFLVLYVS